MKFDIFSHRFAELIVQHPEFNSVWNELRTVIESITDEDLKKQFPLSSNKMSLSAAINDLLRERLVSAGWQSEAPIFQGNEYEQGDRWRLDFAKESFSVEVAFNHGEAIAWNLLKPILASELNHVKKAVQTRIGVIITATDEMKSIGAFDSAVGSYEKVLKYLTPFNNILTVPLLIIGLHAPKSFRITKVKKGNTNIGVIEIKEKEFIAK